MTLVSVSYAGINQYIYLTIERFAFQDEKTDQRHFDDLTVVSDVFALRLHFAKLTYKILLRKLFGVPLLLL